MKIITLEQVEGWIGNDQLPSEIHQLIYELVNGEYEVEQMRKDITFFEKLKENNRGK